MAESRNPFSTFTNHKLKNGMKIILAPNQNSKNIKLKLEVRSGRWSEDKETLHGNHVLEHMLFKDGSIEGDKSYLEVIKEAGGDVNAYVTNHHTAYHTNIPAEKGEWLIGVFKKMLFFRNLDEHELKLGQSSVELEIGKPFIFNRWIRANPIGNFFSFYFPEKSFSEREFGVTQFPYSREDERIAVRRLGLETVKGIYSDFYYPSNMTLLISGKFNAKSMLELLDKTFSNVEDKNGKTLRPFVATKKGKSLHMVQPSFDGDQANLSYGIKLFNKKAEDVLVVESYLNYVAHRLMIEFRNKRGETYTAHSQGWYTNKHGYHYVFFNTPTDKYESNKDYLINLITRETVGEELTTSSVKEAVDLYLKEEFESKDVDAEGLMNLAELKHDFMTEFKETKDPYTILKNISEEEYKRILTDNFKVENSYTVEELPPVLFRYDFFVTLFLSIMAAIVVFKYLLQNHDEIRNTVWLVKTSTTPGKVIEVLTLFVSSLLLSYLIQRPVETLYEDQLWYRSSIVLSTYLDVIISMFVLVGIFMLKMSFLPTSLICTGEKLVIKSLILKEETIIFDNVLEVNLIGPFMKHRFRYLLNSRFSIMAVFFNWAFWKPSLEIKTKSGTSYVLNVNNAKDIVDKIKTSMEAVPATMVEQAA